MGLALRRRSLTRRKVSGLLLKPQLLEQLAGLLRLSAAWRELDHAFGRLDRNRDLPRLIGGLGEQLLQQDVVGVRDRDPLVELRRAPVRRLDAGVLVGQLRSRGRVQLLVDPAGSDRLVGLVVGSVSLGQLLVGGEVSLLDLLLRVVDRRAARGAAEILQHVPKPSTAAADAEDDEAQGEDEREEDEHPLCLAPKLREEHRRLDSAVFGARCRTRWTRAHPAGLELDPWLGLLFAPCA